MGWQTRRRWRALIMVLFVVYLTVQIAVPISRFGASPTARFGWQMFATSAPAPEFVVVTGTGQTQPVALDEYVAFPRADLALADLLPPHLCRRMPDAVQVKIRTAAVSDVFSCP